MSESRGLSWVTFWDKSNRRVLILADTGNWSGGCDWSMVAHDEQASKPGVYDVWRELQGDQKAYSEDNPLTGDIVCIEYHYKDEDDWDECSDFPGHLIDRRLLGYPTMWTAPFSFMQWSPPGDEVPRHDQLAAAAREFLVETTAFAGFTDWVFTVGELLDDPNWEWGWAHGVYCFVRDGTVVYVGRALTTLGERIADQLRSKSDPRWAEIVTDRKVRVRVLAVDTDKAYMASALEAYLIDQFRPEFNLKKQ